MQSAFYSGSGKHLQTDNSGGKVAAPTPLTKVYFRFAKNFSFGGKRAMLSLDLYNALNVNPVIIYNNSFTPGGPWLQPNSILTGRLARVSAEWTF